MILFFEDFDQCLMDNEYANRECIQRENEDMPEEEIQKIVDDTRQMQENHILKTYNNGVESTFEKFLDYIGLETFQLANKKYKVEPAKGNWNEVLTSVRNTINGIGIFAHYNSNAEFMQAQNYSTPRQAVLACLKTTLQNLSEVYGYKSIAKVFESNSEVNL